jgi:ubiquinone/menaquinone biosynthesis C-methylase UbiE
MVGGDSDTGSEAQHTHQAGAQDVFAHQAPSFEAAGSILTDREVLDWICGPLPNEPDQTVLDLAGGTGQLGRHLARRGGLAVIADLTSEMLQEGTRAAREEGAGNVIFIEADATRLPFADEQFDLVVSRLAFHHIDDPSQAACEMARVCRAGGMVAIADMVSQPGECGERHDEPERPRGASHAPALEEAELLRVLRGANVSATILGERTIERPWVIVGGTRG